MTRSKLGLLGLCAVVLGVMAMSASSVQAAGSWLVLNAAGTVATEVKKEGEKVNLLVSGVGELDSASATLLTHLVGLKLGLSCTAFTTSGIHLAAEGKFTEGGKIVFTGCTVSEGGTGCTVKSPGAAVGTVASEEGKGELILHELKAGVKEVLTKIEPKTAGGSFATLRFEGECSLPEVNKVSGVIYLKDCEGFAETFAVKHLVVQGPLTSVSIGADTAEHLETSVDGSAWVKLSGEHAGLQARAMGV